MEGVNKRNYWKTLKQLKLYSLERRRERYRIIYIWKILEQLVPNVNSKIQEVYHERTGRKCKLTLPHRGVTAVFNAQCSSICYHGVKLFNVLPKNLRNMSGVSVQQFKSELDKYLATVPDEPQIPGYTQLRRSQTNSLVDMIPLAIESRRRLEDLSP